MGFTLLWCTICHKCVVCCFNISLIGIVSIAVNIYINGIECDKITRFVNIAFQQKNSEMQTQLY